MMADVYDLIPQIKSSIIVVKLLKKLIEVSVRDITKI